MTTMYNQRPHVTTQLWVSNALFPSRFILGVDVIARWRHYFFLPHYSGLWAIRLCGHI